MLENDLNMLRNKFKRKALKSVVASMCEKKLVYTHKQNHLEPPKVLCSTLIVALNTYSH